MRKQDSPLEIWTKALALLKERLADHIFKMWIEPLKTTVENGCIILTAPNDYFKKRITEDYLEKINGVLAEANNEEKVGVEIASAQKKKGSTQKIIIEDPQLILPGFRPKVIKEVTDLRKSFTFKNFFIRRDFNGYAYDSIMNALRKKKVTQTVIIVSEALGNGGTHLLQAATSWIRDYCPEKKFCFLDADAYMTLFFEACAKKNVNIFKEKLRNFDGVFIDDIHYLGNKNTTLHVQLSLLIDHLLNQGKIIILSSSLDPDDIPKMDAGLLSRLNQSIKPEIEQPRFEDRFGFLKKLIGSGEFTIPMNIAEYLAGELSGINLGQLKGTVINLFRQSQFYEKPVSIESARKIVEKIAQRKKTITSDLIKKVVAKEFNLAPNVLSFSARAQGIVRARQVAMHFCDKYLDLNHKSIGKAFKKSRYTVIYSLEKIGNLKNVDPAFRGQLEFIEKKLLSKI